MKKLLSFVLILMICCSSALLFAGCDKNTTFLFVTGTGAVTSETKELDNEGRIIYTFNFELYEGDEMNRRSAEKKALEKVVVNVYEKINEEQDIKDGVPNSSLATLKTLKASEMTIANFSLKTTTGSTPRTATVSYDGATAIFYYTVTE